MPLERNMQLVDANVILRFILNDHDELTPKATKIIENNHLFCPFEVVCEIVFVLQKVYKSSRIDIKNALITLFDSQNISTNDLAVMKKGLGIYSSKNIDFVDALLCAYNIINGDIIHSFDKKLNSITNNN